MGISEIETLIPEGFSTWEFSNCIADFLRDISGMRGLHELASLIIDCPTCWIVRTNNHCYRNSDLSQAAERMSGGNGRNRIFDFPYSPTDLLHILEGSNTSCKYYFGIKPLSFMHFWHIFPKSGTDRSDSHSLKDVKFWKCLKDWWFQNFPGFIRKVWRTETRWCNPLSKDCEAHEASEVSVPHP
jgi:hypothetical protein